MGKIIQGPWRAKPRETGERDQAILTLAEKSAALMERAAALPMPRLPRIFPPAEDGSR